MQHFAEIGYLVTNLISLTRNEYVVIKKIVP